MERANALFAGVGFEVPHDHLSDEEPGSSGSTTIRLRIGGHELVSGRFHLNAHLRFDLELQLVLQIPKSRRNSRSDCNRFEPRNRFTVSNGEMNGKSCFLFSKEGGGERQRAGNGKCVNASKN